MTSGKRDDPRADRFNWKPGDLKVSQCATCRWKMAGAPGCAAFPDQIPIAILIGEFDHRKPYPGDRGIQYELTEKKT